MEVVEVATGGSKRLYKPRKPRTRGKVQRKRVGANKVKSLSKLKKECDRLFSLWNRQRYADKNGLVKSFTGTETKHWKSMHNGHYISRSCLALRWDENNARPQSPAENIWKHGNPIEFRINLVKEIGEGAVEALENRRNELFKPTRQFYEELVDFYEKKLLGINQLQEGK